ncbi:MAG: sodium:alanine symporter family protein [Clostridia bacterium]|nr:sodium:alanine symporter family protein [Clostridia bacterium]
MESAASIISGVLMPCILLAAGIFFGIKLRFFWIRHPIRTVKTMLSGADTGGTSPFAALTMALAGTLGVGNIAGVATAITAGGAGAVFWMLIGALAAMSVKYAEVFLAVRHRRVRREDGQTTHYGGAMYYIRDGLRTAAKSAIGRRFASALGGIFAVLCLLNSLLTGNVIQVRAAADCVEIPPILFAALFAAFTVFTMAGGMRRLSAITVVLIPILAALYILLSGTILIAYASEIPRICAKIVCEAFDFASVGGGVLGFGVSRALRFGITRGIFSNEAGCGTAPTAHACANVKSPHHQGCFGLFEVFADTVVLCTMTALVILLYADGEGLDGIGLSLAAYTRLGASVGGTLLGTAADRFLRISILLFAYATVVCQSCYGIEAIRYFAPARGARILYIALSVGATFAGALLQPGILWQWADMTVSVMTIVNVACVLRLRKQIEA